MISFPLTHKCNVSRSCNFAQKWRFLTSFNFYVVKFKYFFDSEKQKKIKK